MSRQTRFCSLHVRKSIVIRLCWMTLLVGWFGCTFPAKADPIHAPKKLSLPGPLKFCTKNEIERINDKKLQGHLLDFTFNHRVDRRFYSQALDCKRDMYVYLPPGYDPNERYPIMIWLHGILQDEKSFLDIIETIDAGMACGDLPPFIIAAPDGSVSGRASYFTTGSFYLNSNAGNFEDYIVLDVWNFMVQNFRIRPEKEAHILAGGSMGGFGAFNLGIKHRDRFGICIGIHPALNLRYQDCRGRYFANYDPSCISLMDKYMPHRPVARFYGVIVIRQSRLIDPLFGRKGDVIGRLSEENPLEMLSRYAVKPNELAMFAAFGRRDEFNIDAQVDSFVEVAKARGLAITTQEDPKGTHSTETGLKFFPAMSAWLKPQIEPYSPKRSEETNDTERRKPHRPLRVKNLV